MQVHAARVDLVAVGREVVGAMCGRVSQAEADDEVQAQVIREWLSGRGLPDTAFRAKRELRRRVVQRIFSDLRGDRRGKLAAHRRDLREMTSWRRSSSADGFDGWVDVLAQLPATNGCASHCEATIAAREAVAAACRGKDYWCRGNSSHERNLVVLSVMADLLSVQDAAVTLGVSDAAVKQVKTRLTEQLREQM